MARLSLTLLGGFQARLDPGRPLALPTRKSQALLAYLALPLGRRHPRDTLAALLWGGMRQESARAGLRQALFFIRKALGEAGGALRQEGDTLALEPKAVDADTATFEVLVREGTPKTLAEAATLYRGDLLSGFALDEAPFEEWLVAERERLRELAIEVLARLLADQMTRASTPQDAVHTALQLLGLDPLQEPVHRALMRLYADSGRRGAALRQYQHCVAVLQRDLGIEPEAETKRLYQEILRQRDEPHIEAREPVSQDFHRDAERRSHAAGEETELIGRSPEIAALRAALASATAGAGRVAVVLGEAGIGKSRLVIELAGDAARSGVTVLLGRSYESEQILPFGPWVDALRASRAADDSALLERLGALRPELARLLPEIGGVATGGTMEVAPVFESVTQLIGHLARRRPVLVILEDLHWADEMSARLFAFVGRRLAGWPVLLVATAREDEMADAAALRRALDDLARDHGLMTTLILRPLSRPDTLTLVSELARNADAAWLERVGEHAWLASEGNPFVVVETVRAHAQGATLDQERGLGLPERVRGIVSRRLDRFSKGAQTVTAVASVIGREFEFGLLQQATPLGEEETAAALEELVRGRVLHGLGEQFDFIHDRIREVAYRRILMPRRKLIHRRVAEAIEATYGGQLTRHALALGLHYRAAEVWDRAAQYLGRAGEVARERAASSEAVACFDTALACLTHLPESRERSERIIDTILSQDAAFGLRGEFQRSLAGLRRAEGLASSLGDRRRLAQCLTRTAYHLGSIDLVEATKKAEQACVITREVGDAAEQMWSNAGLAWVHYARGDYRRAMEAVWENDALASGAPHIGADLVSYSWFYGVLALTELGEFAEALVRGEQVLRMSAAESGRRAEVWAHLAVGRLCLVKGELPRAIEVLEWCLPLCEVGGDLAVYFSRAASSLGSAYALSGRIQEAVPLLERADSHVDSVGLAYGHAVVLTALAETRLLAGDIQQAGRDIARARALAHQHGQRGWEGWALRLSGEIAARSDPPEVESAEACFSGAIALARKRSMRPLVAHCHLGLGGLYRRSGDGAKAEEHLATAAVMYRDMSMGFWLSQATAGGAGGN